MIYEILNNNGQVVNTIVADQAFVDAEYPGHYRLVGADPTPYVSPIVTKLAFRFRMTDAEYVGILAAAKTDIEVAAWVETFNMVNQINLDDSRTKSGLDMMVTKTLLTAQRATEILTAPVQPDERP
jgi:hypothetical protein